MNVLGHRPEFRYGPVCSGWLGGPAICALWFCSPLGCGTSAEMPTEQTDDPPSADMPANVPTAVADEAPGAASVSPNADSEQELGSEASAGGVPSQAGGEAPPALGGSASAGGASATGGGAPDAPAAEPSEVEPADPSMPKSTCPAGRELVWWLNFSDPNWAGGEAGVTAALQALGTEPMAGAGNVSVVSDPVHGNVIEVLYPEDSGSISCVESSQCVTEGGLVFRAPLPDGANIDSVVLSYWLKFEQDFQWVKGGKLPGLCGGACSTGGRDVETDRFSIRYMWRGDGTAMLYTYLTNPPNNGTGLNLGSGSWHWEDDGQWHRIQEELILNTGNENDGIIRVWYDRPTTEAPDFERGDLRYYDRTQYSDLGIDKLIFSTFHGGQDASWSPARDVRVYFADIQVCR